MNLRPSLVPLAVALALGPFSAANADTYTSATFSFATNGGNANVKAPFNSVISQGESFTGTLVYDNNLVPGAGTGFQNVFFSTFPDIANIPSVSALSLSFTGLRTFTLNDAQVQFPTQEAAIQYKNGVFNGLFYISDFTFQGNPYELQIQGTSFDIVAVVGGNPTFNHLVNGRINFGLSNLQSFTPIVQTAVPELSTWAMLLLGFLSVSLMAYRRKSTPPLVAV